ncbi:MAG: alginate O-acetyltransferase AlgX-related protein [Trueperaceae bacterium]
MRFLGASLFLLLLALSACQPVIASSESLNLSPIISGNLCPDGIATEAHEQWWPVPGFIPARDGWVFSEWDLRTNFSISEDATLYMKRLVEALRAKGIILVGVPIPSRGMLHGDYLDKTNPLAAAYSSEVATQSYLEAIKQYEALGIVMVNPLPYLTKNTDGYSFKNDMHWRPEGARQVAWAVADTLSTLPEIAELPKSDYTVSETGSVDFAGIYSYDSSRLCNTSFPKEPLPLFGITGGPDLGLLEETTTDVMLLGSSFSTESFAFDKFIKEATGLDMVTLATDGGTKWYSLERLLIDENTPLPKVLLWEFPAIEIQSWEIPFLRRIIPMVYGSCTEDNTLLYQEGSLSSGNILLENTEGLAVTGSSYTLQLDFPDVTVRNFLINFMYEDGSSEQLRVQRNERVENTGRYLLELSNTHNTKLARVEFLDFFEEGYQGDVVAKLCQIQ